MTTADRPLVVDLYARLSRCPVTGKLEKVDKQLADGRAVAERRGWIVGREHRDNSLSAWRRGVHRPGWEAMLTRVEAGEVDGVVCWHTDRMWRQPIDLEKLIQIGERGLLVASAYGEHDLANPDHRMVLRVLAANACKSSDDASRRIKNKFGMMREAGMTNGGARAFGFPGADRTAPRGEDGKRPAVPAAQVERERAALRAAAEEIADGSMKLAEVSALWNGRGLRSATGATWTPVTVREVLERPRNAGLVEHNGAVVGRMPGEPILDKDLYDRVRAVFAGRRRGRVAGESYVASGILLCGECGKPVSGRPHSGTYPNGEPRRQYHCPKSRGGCGKVAADQRRVDQALRDLTLLRLGDRQHVAQLAAAAAETAKKDAELAAKITRAQMLTKQLSDRLGRLEMELDDYDAAMRPLREQIARMQAERDALPSAGADDLPNADAGSSELARQWDDGDVAERRSLLLTALRGQRARLLPARSRVWSPDRIEVTPIQAERP